MPPPATIEPPEASAATVGDYLSLVRFSHTLFALPVATVAAIMAWRVAPFRWLHLAAFLVCMVAARTAAMAFNRLADAEVDAANPRTANRELPAGTLSRPQVIGLIAGSILVFVVGTLGFWPNPWPLALSPGVLAILLGYSLAKRFTWLCHHWLGLALGLSPIAAYVAITGTIAPPPVLLGLAILFWVGGFDILYACQDEAFDREIGLHSVPARFGTPAAFAIARTSHVWTVAMLLWMARTDGRSAFFYGGIVLIAATLVVEHLIVSPDDLKRVGVAFFQMNLLVSFGTLVLYALDLFIMAF